MKRIIAVLLGTMTLFLLAACGSSRDSAAPAMGDSQEAADVSAAAETTDSELPSDYNQEEAAAAEAPVLVPALDEVIEDVLNYAESEGRVVVDEQNINDIIEGMYYSEGPDALGIFNTLCAAGQIVSAPVEPEGIIVLRYINGSNRTWNSTGTYAMTTFTVKLDCIDPDTGKVSNLRTFSSEDTGSCSVGLNALGTNVTQSLMHFNSDLTQMTATLTLEDGSVHVGWIDESGRFTDVSARITADAGDFGALTKHSNPCFGPGGYFYFRDVTNANVQDKRVPLNSLTASAVETLNDRARTSYLVPRPDGTTDEHSYYYYDENMEYPTHNGIFYDWISPFECVGVNDYGQLYRYTLSGKTSPSYYTEKTLLVPDIKGRRNRDPVVSPDGTEVAFLSALTTGTDSSPYLYIVPSEGGDPVKVATDYVFDNNTIWNYSGGGDFYAAFLLAWK